MRITMDNEDGRGAVDYTGAVAVEGPVTVQRRLNQPSRCTAEIVLGVGALATPVRRGRVEVTSDVGAVLFTGYLATEPVAVYAGQGATGAVYRARISAVSDEWLLDRQGSGGSLTVDGVSLALSGTALLEQLTARAQAAASASGTAAGSTAITVSSGGTNARATGAFAVAPAASWSTNAGAAAAASYAGYRAVSGTVSVQPAGSVTHSFSDASGTLSVAEFNAANVRELANDVTISGAEEPAAYVQEIFTGDGTTTVFTLSESAFRGTNRTLVRDSFNGASFDTSQWVVGSTGGHLALGSAGLMLNGGNGYDGQTTLTALNAVEMGGFLLAELGGCAVRGELGRNAGGFLLERADGAGELLCGFPCAAECEFDRWRNGAGAGGEWRRGRDGVHADGGAQLHAAAATLLRGDAAAAAGVLLHGGWGCAAVWRRECGGCGHADGV